MFFLITRWTSKDFMEVTRVFTTLFKRTYSYLPGWPPPCMVVWQEGSRLTHTDLVVGVVGRPIDVFKQPWNEANICRPLFWANDFTTNIAASNAKKYKTNMVVVEVSRETDAKNGLKFGLVTYDWRHWWFQTRFFCVHPLLEIHKLGIWWSMELENLSLDAKHQKSKALKPSGATFQYQSFGHL